MIVDGGGGRNGLTFYIPSEEEDAEADDIISNIDNEKHDEFIEKHYHPSHSIGLRIDIIVP